MLESTETISEAGKAASATYKLWPRRWVATPSGQPPGRRRYKGPGTTIPEGQNLLIHHISVQHALLLEVVRD
ncbi:MAG: hypothetical protein WA637_20630, partial [Terriglobales bacterium]